MKNNQRRKKYLGTSFQNKMLFLVFASAVIPAVIIAACLYYLIFHMLALQMVFPEAIAYNVMPVLDKINVIIAVALPLSLFLIWIIALELSHRIAGPLYRMEKELDERINGHKHGPIRLREKDEFKLLADKFNKLICK
jgi:signal transduction histidine kinase